jgi:glyoxylase-like metal-dependent hydrolase (beta-lactamase superfamily II)
LRIPKFKNVKPFDNSLMDVKIIEAFGHTPGHCCIQYKEYLFCGDLINSRNNSINLTPNKYVFNEQQSIESIKRLNLDGVKFIYPAHGKMIKVEDFIAFVNGLK